MRSEVSTILPLIMFIYSDILRPRRAYVGRHQIYQHFSCRLIRLEKSQRPIEFCVGIGAQYSVIEERGLEDVRDPREAAQE